MSENELRPIGYVVFCASRGYTHGAFSVEEVEAEADATLFGTGGCGPHFVRRVYGE